MPAAIVLSSGKNWQILATLVMRRNRSRRNDVNTPTPPLTSARSVVADSIMRTQDSMTIMNTRTASKQNQRSWTTLQQDRKAAKRTAISRLKSTMKMYSMSRKNGGESTRVSSSLWSRSIAIHTALLRMRASLTYSKATLFANHCAQPASLRPQWAEFDCLLLLFARRRRTCVPALRIDSALARPNGLWVNSLRKLGWTTFSTGASTSCCTRDDGCAASS
mmetsp:Transcript_103379/g.323401  ORF Transcript_103379/g.323401 Transcript_103379/m.323401 type:complete len:220 (+) Transcript_103379:782-1441(+)